MRKTFVNIRGTNGSGKSTLARKFLGEHDATVELVHYLTKAGKPKVATGIFNPERNALLVGNYSTMAGGLDKLPNFEVQQQAIEVALEQKEVDVVIAEGILASTVMGSWDKHAERLANLSNVRVIWAFMTTPLLECVRRVQERPKATSKKDFKPELVADKHRTINRVLEKATTRPYIEVISLPFLREWERICEVLGWTTCVD